MLLRSYLFKNTCVRIYNGNFVTKTTTSSMYELPLFKHRLFSTSRNKHIRMKYNNRNVQTLEPVIEGLVVERGNLDGSRLVKPFFFTIGFSSASFVGAAIWQYENLRAKGRIPFYSSARWMQEKTAKFGKWRNDFNRWWNRLSDAERVYIPICLINILVFLAWRVPSFQPTMVKYFCSNPAARK
ncbi:hypothetical protein O3M35_010887 [Rhynocoris fuscipes]|uniref:Transmembrane protein n=1 Tax=Rhynocoris fuscipes TaxID=488301 RepID=A0AAW1D3S5_9HEMI